MEYVKKIEGEVLNQLPLRFFEGPVNLISDLKDLNNALPRLFQAKEFGFDTETRPSFKKGVKHQVALLQLATSEEVYLFRLNKIGLPDELIDLLADKSKIKVGAAIRDDIKSLAELKSFEQSGFVDLQEMVKK